LLRHDRLLAANVATIGATEREAYLQHANARILYPIEDERLVGLPTCRTFRDTFGP
jgi:hypothetical protein